MTTRSGLAWPGSQERDLEGRLFPSIRPSFTHSYSSLSKYSQRPDEVPMDARPGSADLDSIPLEKCAVTSFGCDL
jgi:hypothetical protein